MHHPAEEPTNPYAPPATSFQDIVVPSPSGEVSRQTLTILQQTRPWVLFLGILGILGSFFMICGSGFMLIGGLAGRGGPMTLVAVMYVVMAIVYVVPSMLLIRFSQRISDLSTRPTVANLEVALQAQKSFWRFVGILAAVVLVIYVLIIVGAMVFGALAAAR